jgi:hypothetical protein
MNEQQIKKPSKGKKKASTLYRIDQQMEPYSAMYGVKHLC